MSNKHSTVNTGAFDALLMGTAPKQPAPDKLQPNRDKLQPKARPQKRNKRQTRSASPSEDAALSSPPPRSTARTMLTLRFDPDVLDRARNACHANNKTFQELIDSALWLLTSKLEQQNGGKPYPPRPGRLKPGPRPATAKS